MFISENGAMILSRLENAGEQAYLVGGCVRDQLLGRPVHDLDIATSALPERIMEIFSGLVTIPTGMKHGTVTVLVSGEPVEITTFRVDNGYSDCRRPDSVDFTDDLELDLSRRDFTMNAVAMDLRGTLTDPFGGISDIKKGIIRCVGEPERRFSEDALRILRAVRFASQLGFEIEEDTLRAVIALRDNLSHVSRERIRDELDKLIMGQNCAEVMLRCREVIAAVIPEFRPCFDFEQHSRYHLYTVYEHIARSVAAAPSDPAVRRAMFFHDIGKPPMFTVDENGEGHFKGHAGLSAEMAQDIMKRLRFSTSDISTVCQLITRHSDKINSEVQIKRMLSKMGIDMFLKLIDVKKSDNLAKNLFVLAENEWFDECAQTARRLVEESSCLTLKDLAVNGNDMIAAGLRGREIGSALNRILELVVEEKLANDKKAILDLLKEEIK